MEMYYFIVNKRSRSGKGADVWADIEKRLLQKKIVYTAWITQYAGHAKLLAQKACEMPWEEIRLIVVGGDGTVNEVINGITDFNKVVLGVIPTGSGNDLARGLGITQAPEQLLDKLLDNRYEQRFDLGEVRWEKAAKSRYFIISAGVGLDAIVCKKALTSKCKLVLNKLHLGKLTYLFLTIESLFSMKTSDTHVVFDAEHKSIYQKLISSAVMNFRTEGGGIPMAPQADAHDGMLSVCSIYGIPKLMTFFVLPFLLFAKQEVFHGVKIQNCQECSLQMKKPMVLHTDGEYCADVVNASFLCHKGKLRLMTDKHSSK